MRMMNKTELKNKIAAAMEKAKKTRDICADGNDRQVLDLHQRASSKVDTLFCYFRSS